MLQTLEFQLQIAWVILVKKHVVNDRSLAEVLTQETKMLTQPHLVFVIDKLHTTVIAPSCSYVLCEAMVGTSKEPKAVVCTHARWGTSLSSKLATAWVGLQGV